MCVAHHGHGTDVEALGGAENGCRKLAAAAARCGRRWSQPKSRKRLGCWQERLSPTGMRCRFARGLPGRTDMVCLIGRNCRACRWEEITSTWVRLFPFVHAVPSFRPALAFRFRFRFHWLVGMDTNIPVPQAGYWVDPSPALRGL